MKHLFRSPLFLFLFFVFFGLGIEYFVFAQSSSDISYPIPELGNCQNKESCNAYCEQPENMEVCTQFAKERNLISPEEAELAQEFATIKNGPGGCTTQGECKTYCSNLVHIDECLEFAKDNNIMSLEEAEEAKKIAKVLKEGVQLPGGCTTQGECEAYCNSASHIAECVTFAERAGIIPPEELEEAKKVADALTRGVQLPGNCSGKEACDAYCTDPSHGEECIAFAQAAGFISPEEAEEAKRIMPLMARGEMPGGCKTKEQCESYCSDDSHLDECATFAAKAGLMSQEELEMYKKTGGKGPGGCKSKEACESFCNVPENQDTCFTFAKDHGLISDEDLREMEESKSQMKSALEGAPSEVLDCMRAEIGEEKVGQILSGSFNPSQQMGDAMKKCFEQIRQSSPQDQEIPFGPGGCRSPEECTQYCANPEHSGECANFGGFSPEGRMNQGPSYPDRPSIPECSTPERCREYCSDPQNAGVCGGPSETMERPMNPEPREFRPEETFLPIPSDNPEFRPQEGFPPVPSQELGPHPEFQSP